MKNLIFGFVILSALLGGGYYLTTVNKTTPTETSTLEPQQQVVAPVETETSVPDLMKDYDTATLEEDLSKGRTVLFFHAKWCSTCKSATRDIETNAEDLPEDLTILRLDYDEETDLKKKYGVFTQHTFVQVDENGDEITKWIGGGVATINTNLQ